MRVKISQLVLQQSVRLKPEEGLELLIASIRERGLLKPIKVSVIPWDCWCEEGRVFHTTAGGKCPKCGVEQLLSFTVEDGFRRVKALQFLEIEELEAEVI